MVGSGGQVLTHRGSDRTNGPAGGHVWGGVDVETVTPSTSSWGSAMNTAYLVVALVTAAANIGIGVADLVPAPFVLATSSQVHVPRSWLPALGLCKVAGGLGVLVGLVGFRPLGVAAAIGLVLFFVGAMIAHVRARVFHNIAGPGVFLGLAAVSLVGLLSS
jgi:DoxX-like protein